MFNVLKSALNIIPRQAIYIRKFIGRTPNDIGIMVNTYGERIKVIGSIQHAERSLIYKMGIANTEDVYVAWIHINAVGVSEIASNDQIISSSGEIFNVIDTDVWYDYPVQDWNKVLVRRAKTYDN